MCYYRPQTKLREGYVFTAVCDSVHRGFASVHAGIPPLRSRHPPEAGTPWKQAPPRKQTPPQKQAPLRKQGPPCAVHAGRCDRQEGGVLPTGMQSCYYYYWYSPSSIFDPILPIKYISITFAIRAFPKVDHSGNETMPLMTLTHIHTVHSHYDTGSSTLRVPAP